MKGEIEHRAQSTERERYMIGRGRGESFKFQRKEEKRETSVCQNAGLCIFILASSPSKEALLFQAIKIRASTVIEQ